MAVRLGVAVKMLSVFVSDFAQRKVRVTVFDVC